MDFGVEDVEIEVVVDWVEFQHLFYSFTLYPLPYTPQYIM